jgi:hypothetical protein
MSKFLDDLREMNAMLPEVAKNFSALASSINGFVVAEPQIGPMPVVPLAPVPVGGPDASRGGVPIGPRSAGDGGGEGSGRGNAAGGPRSSSSSGGGGGNGRFNPAAALAQVQANPGQVVPPGFSNATVTKGEAAIVGSVEKLYGEMRQMRREMMQLFRGGAST